VVWLAGTGELIGALLRRDSASALPKGDRSAECDTDDIERYQVELMYLAPQRSCPARSQLNPNTISIVKLIREIKDDLVSSGKSTCDFRLGLISMTDLNGTSACASTTRKLRSRNKAIRMEQCYIGSKHLPRPTWTTRVCKHRQAFSESWRH
jgi:hypothetical protein